METFSVDYEPRRIDLINPAFTRGMLADLEQRTILDAFHGEVAQVICRINDGKEATVYLCEARPEVGVPLLAAKMYRANKFRAFRSNSRYADERPVRDRRLAKAMRQKTPLGTTQNQLHWVKHEWDTLNVLHEAGVAVPKPIGHCDAGVLMEFIGDSAAAAPMLSEMRLDAGTADRVWWELLRNIEGMLACGVVHGDLSAYNVLMFRERLRIIDVPQSLDVNAPSAFACLERDVANVARYFARAGVTIDVPGIVIDLWQRRWG